MTLPDALAVIETDDAYLVAFGGDPADWVAAFARREGFPARAWAERMAALYNRREFPEAVSPPPVEAVP